MSDEETKIHDTEAKVLFKICAELQKCILDLQYDNDMHFVNMEECKQKLDKLNPSHLESKINHIWNTLSFHRQLLDDLEKDINNILGKMKE